MQEQTMVLEVCPLSDLQTFVSVPHFIYRTDTHWAGQNDADEMKFFSHQHNPGLAYHDWQPFCAMIGNTVVGRIGVSVWKAFNDRWNKAVAFFGFFECINDQVVADRLFEAAKEWARGRGMQELWGPIAFNLEGAVGILIEGFEKLATYGLAYNLPYYEFLCENYGFRKEKDFMELNYPLRGFCENAESLLAQVIHLTNDQAYTIRPVTPESFSEDIQQIISVQNRSMRNHWGSGEVRKDEMIQKYHDLYYKVGPKDLLVVAEHWGQIVGFSLFHQDLNQHLHATSRGYPGMVTRVRGNTIGILPEYQNMKIGTWLTIEIAKRLQQYDFQEVQIGWILEDNAPSLRKCANFGGKIDKVFRVYSIAI